MSRREASPEGLAARADGYLHGMSDMTNSLTTTQALLRGAALLVAFVVTGAGVLAWTFGGAMVAAGDVARSLPEATAQLDRTTASTLRVIGAVRTALEDLDEVTDQVSTGATAAATSLDGVAAMTTHEIPRSLEAIQAALPGLIEAGAVIDRSLRSLALFGVDYAPEVPFDDALRDLERTLEGVPRELRAQGSELETLAPTIAAIGSATDDLSSSLGEIDLALSQAASSLDGWRSAADAISSSGRPFEGMTAFAGPLWRALIVATTIAGWALAWVLWMTAGRISQLAPIVTARPWGDDPRTQQVHAMTNREQ